MAQNENQVDIAIKLGADISGGVQSRAELEKIRAQAKRTANETASGFGKLKLGAEAVSKSIGFINKALMGFGVVGLLMPIVNLFKSWHDEAKKTEEAARNLRKELEMKAAAAQVKEVASAYKELTDAINETKEARLQDQQVFDEEVRVRREAEDAEMAADEADALAAVDPNAEDADKQKQRIRETFGAKRKRLAADRKKEDVVLRRQKLQGEADAATAAADKIEESLGADDKAILRTKIRANTLDALSKERNEKDGTWYNPRKKTEEGNAVREQQRKEAEQAREEVKRLEADKKAKEKQIAALRAQASTANKIRNVIGKSIDTAELERENVNVEEDTQAAANAASDKKEADKKAKERKEYDDAKQAIELLKQEKAELESRKNAAQANKDRANRIAFNAEGDYETAKRDGSRSEQASKGAVFQNAKRYAQDVSHEADKTINSVNTTLSSIASKLRQFQHVVENFEKRASASQAESPSGQ